MGIHETLMSDDSSYRFTYPLYEHMFLYKITEHESYNI